MQNQLLIYGCYGYTGQLISEHAVQQGMKPVLAGRDEARTRALAQSLNLDYKVFDLKDEAGVAAHLKGFTAVLHCAGPFRYTAGVMMRACMKTKTHYLDITGEIEVFESAFSYSAQAAQAGVMLMPGVGFDVVPTDCLALHLKNSMPDAESLQLAMLQKGGRTSHGTAITVAEYAGEPCLIRRNGKLEKTKQGTLTRAIDFGDKQRTAVAISWGDVSTAYHTTGIPNITVYNALPEAVIRSMKLSNYLGFLLRLSFVKNRVIKKIKQRPAGPDESIRQKATGVIWGEVKNAEGKTHHALLQLPEGYTLTAWTAVKIAQEVLNGTAPAGAKTPAQVFGSDFILQFNGVERKNVDF